LTLPIDSRFIGRGNPDVVGCRLQLFWYFFTTSYSFFFTGRSVGQANKRKFSAGASAILFAFVN
jgi:hypothetical protein